MANTEETLDTTRKRVHRLFLSMPGSLKTRLEVMLNRGALAAYFRRRLLQQPATIYADDTFLVSFPRSGSTWIRYLLTNMIWNRDVLTATVVRVIPGVHLRRDRDLVRVPPPRLLKSHCPLNPRYPRVVYIVRDGRDVAVSYYYRRVTHGFVYGSFSPFLTAFLDGRVGSQGTWQDHVEGWLLRRSEQVPLLLVRFEDLKADTGGQLARLSDFLNISYGQKDLEEAIRSASFSNMRQMEEARRPRLDESDKFATRKGIVGDWRHHFSAQDEALFWEKAGDAMRLAGYGE